ncbi:MAG: undecaprenyl-phosphate galactose phosphotransferase WbaP [Treponema sp.]|jgi:Undecaprenyl-phosphate galactose phosphotransferase WbaP|nr:undecaprenyl-phosphate galactose phosphotransferase WbaP [Treponema sp.]
MLLTEFETWYRTRYRRTSSALTTAAFILADLIGVMLSFGSGFFLVNAYDMQLISFRAFVTYWPYLPVFILFFLFNGLYPGVALAPAEELRHFSISSLLAHGGILLSRYVEDKEWDPISIAFIISFILSQFILLVCRDVMRFILDKTKLGGIPAVIFGSGITGRLIINQLLKSRSTGYIPVLILNDEKSAVEDYRGVPIIHNTSIAQEIVERFNIKMAILAMQGMDRDKLKRLLNDSMSVFRYNVIIPDLFSVTNIWVSVRDFGGVLGLVTSHRLRMFWNWGIKRFMDLTLVFIGGTVLLPFLLFIGLLVKISSPGPALYGHTRLGLNGKKFKAYKFRSMVADSDERLKRLLDSDPRIREEWEASHKLKDDPRITKIGRILRKFSFDEFPQLINVLKGEMSLVGPRPIVEDEIEKYGEDFKRIFSVKPGLTGLWQVSGRSDTDYAERVSFDTYYLQSWSIWLDLWVLYKTIGVVVKGKGAY